MKKLSLEQVEKIEGGCIEYGLAWAEATWLFLNSETQIEAAWYSAKATYYFGQWVNCSPVK